MSDTPRPNDGQQPSGLPTAEAVAAKLQAQGNEERGVNLVLWLLGHGRAQGMNKTDLARFARIDPSTLGKVLDGTYPTHITGIADRIEKTRSSYLEEQAYIERPIVQTWTLNEIGKVCDATRADETMTLLIGRSHSGKTTALEYYAGRNPHVVYMTMPVGGAARIFLQDLAEASNATARGAYDQVRRNVINRFRSDEPDAPQLLIIDEAHQTIIGRRVQTVTLELIRELHDKTHCPVVICATPVMDDKMRDQKLKTFFEQMDNRSPLPRHLPKLPPMCDLNAIFAAYGLPPAPARKLHPDDEKTPDAVVQEIRAKNGLGKLVKLVRKARRVARKKQVKLDWSHVLDVVATGDSWANGDGPEDGQDGKEGR